MSELQEVFWTSERCCTSIAWCHSRDLTITEGFSHTQCFLRDFLQISTHLQTNGRATERKFQNFSYEWELGHEAFVLCVVTVRQIQWVVQQRVPTPLWTLEFSKHFHICTLPFAHFYSSSNLLCPYILKWNEFMSPSTLHAASFSRPHRSVEKIYPWVVLCPFSRYPVTALLIAVVSI